MQLPELDFKTCMVEDIQKNLILNGCCLLRNAIDPNIVMEVKNTVQRISDRKADDVRNGVPIDTHQRFHIEEKEYKAFNNGTRSFHDLLADPKYKKVLDLIFGENSYQANENTYTRGIDPRPDDQGRDLTSFRPLDFHIDAVYHHPKDKFAINFWVPFDECGHDRPSLQVVPMNYQLVRELIEYTPDTGFSFSEPTVDESRWSTDAVWKRVVNKAPAAVAWHPTFKIGDVLLMNSWILHASYFTKNMRKPRRSVEIRFMGDQLDPQPLSLTTSIEMPKTTLSSFAGCRDTTALATLDKGNTNKAKNIFMALLKRIYS